MTKKGDYYWVFANITPDYSNGKIVGFTSVRKPNPEAFSVIEPLYKKLCEIESRSGVKASKEHLMQLLDEKQMSYDELILSLQGV